MAIEDLILLNQYTYNMLDERKTFAHLLKVKLYLKEHNWTLFPHYFHSTRFRCRSCAWCRGLEEKKKVAMQHRWRDWICIEWKWSGWGKYITILRHLLYYVYLLSPSLTITASVWDRLEFSFACHLRRVKASSVLEREIHRNKRAPQRMWFFSFMIKYLEY
jgi:hypothetical protein